MIPFGAKIAQVPKRLAPFPFLPHTSKGGVAAPRSPVGVVEVAATVAGGAAAGIITKNYLEKATGTRFMRPCFILR